MGGRGRGVCVLHAAQPCQKDAQSNKAQLELSRVESSQLGHALSWLCRLLLSLAQLKSAGVVLGLAKAAIVMGQGKLREGREGTVS